MAVKRCGGRFDAATEVLVELVAGEGVEDSRQFARDMMTMYVCYGRLNGLVSEILADDDSHLTVRFAGAGAGKRVPETERNGRRQTSVVAVMVLPMPPVDQKVALLPVAELDIKFQPKGGPGGQHRNKTASACRMRHVPTGLSVFIDGRMQHQNRELAHRILSGRVADLQAASRRDGYDGIRREQWTGASRGAKVRTYNLIDSRVTDHMTGKKTSNVKAIMKGELALVLGE